MSYSSVRVEFFTGRAVYEALALRSCHDDVRVFEALHNLP